MFRRISEEVGSTDSGEIRYRKLYGSSLSSFLSDVQIYKLIRKFKLKQKELGGGKQNFRGRTISEDIFVAFYPVILSEVTSPNLVDSPVEPGLDVAFENLCLTVDVSGKEVKGQ